MVESASQLPVILVADAGGDGSAEIALRRRYADDYEIVGAADDPHGVLDRLQSDGRSVALFLAADPGPRARRRDGLQPCAPHLPRRQARAAPQLGRVGGCLDRRARARADVAAADRLLRRAPELALGRGLPPCRDRVPQRVACVDRRAPRGRRDRRGPLAAHAHPPRPALAGWCGGDRRRAGVAGGHAHPRGGGARVLGRAARADRRRWAARRSRRCRDSPVARDVHRPPGRAGRRRDRGGRPGGARRRGLRGFRGPVDRRARGRGTRWAGGVELAHPQLPRLSARGERHRAREPRVPAGVGLRHRLRAVARRDGAADRRSVHDHRRTAATRFGLARSCSRPESRSGGCAHPDWSVSWAHPSSMARPPWRRRRSRGGPYTSWVAATPRARRLCTSPGMRHPSRSSFEGRRSPRACRPT